MCGRLPPCQRCAAPWQWKLYIHILQKYNALSQAQLQDVLAIVGSKLHVFNEVNLSTAVNCMAKRCDPAVGLASAAQHPAFAQLKTAVSVPQAIL